MVSILIFLLKAFWFISICTCFAPEILLVTFILYKLGILKDNDED